jgi:drug/metabolite transporter (DMT)-like permease
MKTNWLSHFYLFMVAVIYGANYSISKWVMDDHFVHPLGFIFYRVSVALILFYITGLFVREKVEKSDHKILFLGGVFGVWINQTLFFYGLHLGSSVHASLLMLATPILVLIISAIVIKEKITTFKIAGIFLGFAGAVMLILASSSQNIQSTVLGDIMVFINAVSFAIYLVIVKKLTHKYHPVTISKWVFLYGWLFCFPTGFYHAFQVNWSSFTPQVWWSFIYVLIFTTYLAYLFNAIALKKVSASIVSVYIYLQPLIAIGIAIIWFQEVLNWIIIISGLAIFSGVILVSLHKSTINHVILKKNDRMK